MTGRARRKSMENLELYDLDNLKSSSSNYSLPPPLPPPRKHRPHLSSQNNGEEYKFLCDMNRQKTDPIYAATPMFTTIPQTNPVKYPRQLIGCRIPIDIIKPVQNKSPLSPGSENSEDRDAGECSLNENAAPSFSDDDNNQDDGDADDADDGNDAETSSGDDMGIDDIIDNDDDNFDDDDDNNTGIVEQIFDRDKAK